MSVQDGKRGETSKSSAQLDAYQRDFPDGEKYLGFENVSGICASELTHRRVNYIVNASMGGKQYHHSLLATYD